MSIQSDGPLKTLYTSPPGRPVNSDTNSASPGRILDMLQLTANISTTVYSRVLICAAEWTRASWRERKCPNVKTVAKGIRTRAHLITSPAFYHWATALHKHNFQQFTSNSLAYLAATFKNTFSLWITTWFTEPFNMVNNLIYQHKHTSGSSWVLNKLSTGCSTFL